MAWKSVHSNIIYVKNNFRQLDVSTSEISNRQLYNQLSKRGLKYYFVTYLLKSCSQHAKEKRRKIVSFYNLFSKILINIT